MSFNLLILFVVLEQTSSELFSAKASKITIRLCFGRQTTLVHGPGATLKGVDGLGNKYYERMTESYGKHAPRALLKRPKNYQTLLDTFECKLADCLLHYVTFSKGISISQQQLSPWQISCEIWQNIMCHRIGRHRWVVYGDLEWKTGQDPTSIPPEWHGELGALEEPVVIKLSSCICHILLRTLWLA